MIAGLLPQMQIEAQVFSGGAARLSAGYLSDLFSFLSDRARSAHVITYRAKPPARVRVDNDSDVKASFTLQLTDTCRRPLSLPRSDGVSSGI